MSKVIKFIEKNSLSLLGTFALLVGTSAVSVTSLVFTNQVKCPDELLK